MTTSIVFPFGRPPLARAARLGTRGALALAPRVSPAAVRVPDPRQLDVPIAFPAGHPQIFVHEGARQALERKLQQAAPVPIVLAVTDNCRHMISCSKRDGVLRARLHHMFLDAPPAVQDALVAYVVNHDRAASQLVGQFIHDSGHRIRATRPAPSKLRTRGDHHDLLEAFRRVNDRYFDGNVDALITWGRKPSRPRKAARRAIKLGSYSATERLIRIHPALDRAWVPRYFVAYVVYHEMLHHVIPASQGPRRMLHPPAFLERERCFRDYERALAWEREHIARLLRA
jgi:hypothetical protein